MQDEPTPAELLRSVTHFIRKDIAPNVEGHAGFKLRVALNTLDLVTRQLTLSGASDAAEHHRLTQLLGQQGALDDLNCALAEGLARGDIDPHGPGVADHLWQTTLEKLAVDQPNYASYRRETERDA